MHHQLGRLGHITDREHDLHRIGESINFLFGIDEGPIKHVHYTGSPTTFIHFIATPNTLEWDDSIGDGRVRWVFQDGSKGHWIPARSEQETEELVRKDREELEAVRAWSKEVLGDDPFLLSDREMEERIGYWEFPELLYLDPRPGQHDLLTTLYLRMKRPAVDTEEEKEAFRVFWVEALNAGDGFWEDVDDGEAEEDYGEDGGWECEVYEGEVDEENWGLSGEVLDAIWKEMEERKMRRGCNGGEEMAHDPFCDSSSEADGGVFEGALEEEEDVELEK